MNKQEIEKAMETLETEKKRQYDLLDALPPKSRDRAVEIVNMVKTCEYGISALERSSEPTASEFLSRAKAICKSVPIGNCKECPLDKVCGEFLNIHDESELIHSVMDYKEDKDAERN